MATYVTKTHLENFTEKLLTNDKKIKDELKQEISNLPSGGGSGSSYTLPTASTTTLGGVKVDGTSTTVDTDGTIHANAQVSADEIKTQVETYLTKNPVSAGFTVDNPFKGKIANFLGDSQTNPGNKGVYTDKGYYDWVKEILELDSYNIYAKNGSALATVPANDVGAISLRYAGMSEDADLIVVMGGVNDRWHNAELGNFGDNTVNTVYGAMEVLCDGLMTKYPGKTIVFVTPTEEDNANCASSNTTGVTVKQIANAMKIVCDKYGMKLYDANTQLGIYPKNAANAAQFTKDKLHLNTKGHELLGKGLSNYILFGSPASYTIINVNGSAGGTGGSGGSAGGTGGSGGSAGGTGGSGGSDSDVSVSSVSISGASYLNVNNSIELTATVSPSNATNQNVTWSIDSDTYATITPNGNKCTVTSKSSVGTATITVTTEDGDKTATKTIFVVDGSSTGLNLSGKRVTSSTYSWSASFLALFVPTDGLVGGETITITGGISELSNVKCIHEGMTVYSATSDVVSDNLGASNKVSNNYVISGTTDSFTLTATLTSAISSFSYMRVLFAIDPTSTASAMSYTISNMAVSVNGVQKDIVAYGPFMSGDNMTIE